MAIPALLGGAARAVGGQMVKSGGKAAAGKILNRKDTNKKKSSIVKKGDEQQKQEGKKSGALAIRPKTTLIPASVLKAPDTKTTSVGSDGILVRIYKKVVEIDKLLKGTLAEEKALTKEKTKQDQREDRDKREGKLEKKKTKEEKKEKGLSIPKLSFFDRIKQFISSIITGFILQKLVDLGPEKLEGIIKAISGGIEFVADLIIGIVDAAGTFLKWGQDAYDATKGWLGDKFGEGAASTFEGFMSNLNKAFNLIGIIALGVAAIDPFDMFGDKKNKKKQSPGADVNGKKPRKGQIIDTETGKVRKKTKVEVDLQKKFNLDDDQIKAYQKARAGGANLTQGLDQARKVKPKPKPKGFFGRIFEGAKDVVKNTGKGLNYLSGGNLGKLGNVLQNQYKNLSKGAKAQFDKVAGVGQKLKGKFTSAMDGVKSFAGKLGESAKKIIVQRLIDPIRPFLDPIVDKVKGIGKKIMEKLSKIPGFDNITKVLKKKGINGIGDAAGILKKVGGKAIPIVGGLFNLLFAYDRLAGGDAIGALLELLSAGFDLSALFGFAPGPGISMGIDAYMFARDFVPQIQETENKVVNGMGLGGLTSGLNSMGSKLPDLDEIVKKFTGGDKENNATVSDPAATGGGASTSGGSGSGKRLGNFDVKKSGDIVNIGKDLISKGFSVAEHPDFTKTPSSSGGAYTPGKGSVSNVHSGDGHYDGRAIDVTDWRGTLEDSKGRYRSILDSVYNDGNMGNKLLIHDSWGIADQTGKDGPGAHGHPSHMHIEVKDNGGEAGKGIFANMGGPEFVLDNDSYTSIKMKYPGFLAALNAADGAGALKVLEAYASYEQGGESTVVINQNQIPASMMQQKQSSSIPIVIPVGGEDPFASAYANC
jgi:hypothetical protein